MVSIFVHAENLKHISQKYNFVYLLCFMYPNSLDNILKFLIKTKLNKKLRSQSWYQYCIIFGVGYPTKTVKWSVETDGQDQHVIRNSGVVLHYSLIINHYKLAGLLIFSCSDLSLCTVPACFNFQLINTRLSVKSNSFASL